MTNAGRIFGTKSPLRRQYAVAAGIFLILVLGIIFLFGHLISGSLSRRYLEDVLAGGRDEAQRIAAELGGAEVKELDVVETRQQVLTRSLEGDPERRIYRSIEVTDSDGKIVFSSRIHLTEEIPEALANDLQLQGTLSDENVIETENPYRISVPLGEVGSVVLNVDRSEVAERVAGLRGDLLGQTIGIAVLTFGTLLFAFAFVWFLIQRTRRLEAQRFEAEEMAALGALAANLAHEIRNPLNSINLNLELLDEDLSNDGQSARDSLASTRAEVGRLAQLVSDFLTYARPSEPEMGVVRVDAMLRDIGEFLTAEAHSMGVHLRVLPGLPAVSVASDEAQLRQVLLNLVLNAVQAVRSLPPDRRVVELDAEEEQQSVALVVRDRGDGIPPDEMERVRKAFYTKRRGGSGLGLAIAERFIEGQGGHIGLVNLEPCGFEARVVLPIDRETVKISGCSVETRLPPTPDGGPMIRKGLLTALVIVFALGAGQAGAQFLAADLIYLPAVTHTNGVDESRWRSDVYITNVDDVAIDVAIIYLQTGGIDNGAVFDDRTFWLGGRESDEFGFINTELASIPPNGTVVLQDPVQEYWMTLEGVIQSGALVIMAYEADSLEDDGTRVFKNAIVNSRAYTPFRFYYEDPDNEGQFLPKDGTYGMNLPGVAWYNLADPSAVGENGDFSFQLLTGAKEDSKFRYNVGMVNASDPLTTITVSLEPIDGNGDPYLNNNGTVLSKIVTLPPAAHIQFVEIFSNEFGLDDVPDDTVLKISFLRWTSGSNEPIVGLTVYGTMIDNRTQDPTAILPAFGFPYNVECQWPSADTKNIGDGSYPRVRRRPVEIPSR